VSAELDKIEAQTLRARDIVQSLLDFARRRTPSYEPVQVNEVVESSLSLITYRLQSHGIAVVEDLAPALPPVKADPGQLQQVFVNIFNNAYQAIRDGEQGTQLVLRTRQSTSRFLPSREIMPPQVIRVTIQNDGPPISPGDLPHIFDPFFTTKEPGEGTGLGLAVSYGIIQEHEGHIWAESGDGEGATFFVELPVMVEDVVAPMVGPGGVDGLVPAPSPPATARALIIEDEPAMRSGLQEVLAAQGFSTDGVADGLAGLAKLEEADYTLLLCDIRMPGLDGIAFFERLRDLYPALAERIIFMTGDAIGRETRRFLEENGLPYLMKPFAIEALQEKVRQLAEK
jgi:two-component system NtrC family sensor kinase